MSIPDTRFLTWLRKRNTLAQCGGLQPPGMVGNVVQGLTDWELSGYCLLLCCLSFVGVLFLKPEKEAYRPTPGTRPVAGFAASMQALTLFFGQARPHVVQRGPQRRG